MRFLVVILLLSIYMNALGLNLYCTTIRKIESNGDYTQEKLDKYQFGTRLEWDSKSNKVYISRCGNSPITKKIECNRYLIDRFYLFNSQFNFQLFPDLTSIEDNGRGGISYQNCKLMPEN